MKSKTSNQLPGPQKPPLQILKRGKNQSMEVQPSQGAFAGPEHNAEADRTKAKEKK
jgi:hypothetical protein